MERNFDNKFERFLKENANQHRLYPSSKVWKGIYSALHPGRKWFGLGIVLLLITGSLLTILITKSPKPASILSNKPQAEKQINSNISVPAPEKQVVSPAQKRNPPPLIAVNDFSFPRKGFSFYPFENSIIAPQKFITVNGGTSAPLDIALTDPLTDEDRAGVLQSPKSLDFSNAVRSSNNFDWTIESVLNSFVRPGSNKRLTLQFSLTPTVSYRKLSANKSFIASAANVPVSYAPLYDINSAVTHKPDLGFEFGLTTKYALASNFRAKAGLQFNINRYDIKAFNSSFEVAKIALRGTAGVDSIYTLSTLRNYTGYKSDWLQNFYFEISMPVGAEVNIMGDDKVQFGVGGTIQPTYVLGDRAYLLSTDYKNYALVPWLTRHWNVSTGLEAFVSYSIGKMRWQVGPQIRYQLLSSFIDKYPVKENLFDFGLKLGISVNK